MNAEHRQLLLLLRQHQAKLDARAARLDDEAPILRRPSITGTTDEHDRRVSIRD